MENKLMESKAMKNVRRVDAATILMLSASQHISDNSTLIFHDTVLAVCVSWRSLYYYYCGMLGFIA